METEAILYGSYSELSEGASDVGSPPRIPVPEKPEDAAADSETFRQMMLCAGMVGNRNQVRAIYREACAMGHDSGGK